VRKFLSSLYFPPERTNAEVPYLVEQIVKRGEGRLGKDGGILVFSGENTGRAAKDKFIVEEDTKDCVWWEANNPMSEDNFCRLHSDVLEYLENKSAFVEDLWAGSIDPKYRAKVVFVGETAWHTLFMRHLLKPMSCHDKDNDNFFESMTVISCPNFYATPERHGTHGKTVIALSLSRKLVIIAGTGYAGEGKKSVFTVLNYIFPEIDVLPMHCSANHAIGNPEDSAIFFGLSGTGKTTLSTSSDRTLIGDDEHGWASSGIFNFEGGCYAKAIRLSEEYEPQIYQTTKRFATVMENIPATDDTREIDLYDSSITENTRLAYPLEYIPMCAPDRQGGVPRNVIILTCDAFGVIPPVARLSPDQAVYHFLSGFTSKISGTEQGIKQPVPTFSACFGAPFIPRDPIEYGNLFRKRICEANSKCWLVNTGWIEGGYNTGSRIPIAITRKILEHILSGVIFDSEFRTDPYFDFEIPLEMPGVSSRYLDPRSGWEDPADYDCAAQKLVDMFANNYKKYSKV